MFLLMFCQLWTDSEVLNCEQSHFLPLACGGRVIGFFHYVSDFFSAPSFLQLQLWLNQIRSSEPIITWTQTEPELGTSRTWTKPEL